MPSQGRKTSVLVSAAIFIILEVAALAMLDRSSTLQDIWINRAAHRCMAALWSGGESLRNYFRLESVNEELVMQNDSLRRELAAFREEARARTERQASDSVISGLRDASRGGDAFSYTPATIVKMSRGRVHNYVILNKGSEDGILPQSGIITDRGVIGIVKSVSRHYSYGLTLMNPDIAISTRVGREGISAPLVWDGLTTDGATVTDIPPHYEIAPGDTVRTSGYSSIFPEGIALGITGESKLVDGSNQHVRVRLFQDFNTAHYVTVTRNLELGEIERLEAEGSQTEDNR
ncbi:MAG TPA: rod shape-determining protein MreC [Candidatus Cryptobacteroides excrementigallinarum]|nr:rod shape-determining protein MreC [Candidatus Cryptobacteroides excrementigallinarum]